MSEEIKFRHPELDKCYIPEIGDLFYLENGRISGLNFREADSGELTTFGLSELSKLELYSSLIQSGCPFAHGHAQRQSKLTNPLDGFTFSTEKHA